MNNEIFQKDIVLPFRFIWSMQTYSTPTITYRVVQAKIIITMYYFRVSILIL